ncbi:hypothetical protein KY330_00475 [Candidatus Woesearchaeota archaeon]|nr:hypothetical protein [Candidatus Woesearchaeota archaeon]
MAYLLEPGQVSDCARYKVIHGIRGENLDCLSQLFVLQKFGSDTANIGKLNIPNNRIDREGLISTGLQVMLNLQSHNKRHNNEVSILKQISHPNIISLLGDITFKDLPVAVLNLCNRDMYGGILFLYPETFRGIEGAVYYLRHNGISHKDIKPDNVIGGKLIDFGIACRVDSDNGIFFNRSFCAPEYFNCKPHKNSDLYSVGLLISYSVGMSLQTTYLRGISYGYFDSKELKPDFCRKVLNFSEEPYEFSKNVRQDSEEFIRILQKNINYFKDNDFHVEDNSMSYDSYISAVDCSGLIQICRYYLNPDPDKRIPPKHLLTEELMEYV